MKYAFCTNIDDEHLDLVMIYDLECDLEIDVTVSGGEVTTVIDDVRIGGKSMFKGDEVTRSLAAKVMAIAEKEIDDGGPLWDEIREIEGISYRGLGGNDPDGEWRQAAE